MLSSHAFRMMLLIRRFEERAAVLYQQGKIGGFCHLYIGQEAVAVGCYEAMKPCDTVVTAYRAHGHMLASGAEPKTVMAELTGRRGGCSKGKGGSMHFFNPKGGFFGGHGIVGAQVPLGTGLAFSHQYRGDQGVCLTFMGDGASNQGQVYEAMNMASLWKLPVLYIIENNEYGMGTSVERSCAGPGLYKRGEGFGIPGQAVDGMDILAVQQAVGDALERIRSGQGPELLEMKTYRYRGHSMSDPGKYRSREAIDHMRDTRDPIDRYRSFFDDATLADLENQVESLVEECVTFALEDMEPELPEIDTDILIA